MMADQRLPITGGCLCGSVRYESLEPPNGGGYCHCRMCRKARGGLFGAALGFHDGAVTVTRGEVKYFKSSEKLERGFYADCGSPVVIREPGKLSPGTVTIGSLDRPDDWPLNQEGWWGTTASRAECRGAKSATISHNIPVQLVGVDSSSIGTERHQRRP